MNKYPDILTPSGISPESNKIKSRFVRWISLILAVVFLSAGIGKVFLFINFSITVASITYLSLSSAKILAAVIIASEILGAIALIIRFKLAMTSIVFCCLVGIFIWVLSMAVIRDREINCNCFGILGLNLSNSSELILDIILFNLFALLAYSAGGSGHLKKRIGEKRRFISRITAPIIIIILEYLLCSPILSKSFSGRKLDSRFAVECAKKSNTQFALSNGGNRLIFLMNYVDLSCPMCFDDFSAFSDSLAGKLNMENNSRIIVLFKSNYFSEPDSSSYLHRWAAANNLNYPIYVVADSLFDKIHFEKSMALITDKDDRILFSNVFPMGKENRRRAIELMSPK